MSGGTRTPDDPAAATHCSEVLLGFLCGFDVVVPDTIRLEDLRAALLRGGFDPKWANPTAWEFDVAEGFLLSAERIATHVRCEIDSCTLTIQRSTGALNVRLCPVLTLYPALDIAVLGFFCRLERISTDDVIFIEQCVRAPKAPLALPEILRRRGKTADFRTLYADAVRECFAHPANAPERGLLTRAQVIEIRLTDDDGDDADPVALVTRRQREIYGMLAMDEGWRHVPSSWAGERIGKPWGTREHMCVATFGRSVIMVDAQYHPKTTYVASQSALRRAYGVEPENYFIFRPGIAALNHGPLLTLETCALKTSFLHKLLADIRQASPKTIHDLLAMRNRLNEQLSRFDTLPIREVDILEERILGEMGFDRAATDLARLLGQIEAELTIRYQQGINRRMTIMTVLGIVLAIIGIFVGVLQIMKP